MNSKQLTDGDDTASYRSLIALTPLPNTLKLKVK